MKTKPHPVTLPEEELLQLLSRFREQRVAVLGDVGIDRYTQGRVDRISPEAPVPIVAVEKETLKLGLAANVADNIVVSGLVPDSSRRTILKERIVAETQQMLRVDYEDTHSLSAVVQKRVLSAALKAVKHSSALIIEDYSKGLLNEVMMKAVITAARKRKIPVLVDPHLKTPARWYSGATLLTPNKKEAEALAGMKIEGDESLLKAGQTIMRETRADSLIITLGKDGMAIFKSAQAKPVLIPTFAREVYDVSGAGDTVISVLALSLASGAKLEEAAFVSNLAAGVEVSKRGTATVSPQEIIQAYLSSN